MRKAFFVLLIMGANRTGHTQDAQQWDLEPMRRCEIQINASKDLHRKLDSAAWAEQDDIGNRDAFREKARRIAQQTQEADREKAACLGVLEQRRRARLTLLPSMTIDELMAIPDVYRLPEEQAALTTLRDRHAEEERRRHEKLAEMARRADEERAELERARRARITQRERDHRWMRPVLSAMVCRADDAVRERRRRLADHLAHPTTDPDYNEATYGLQEDGREAEMRARDMRQRMKGAGMSPLPCAGEVRRIISCIGANDEARCRDERMLGYLELIHE